VLALLRNADGGVTVDEVAHGAGLHVNTARFHLDKLVEDGLAERQAEERGTPGRPRIRYLASGAERPTSYRLLSRMLVGLVSSLGAHADVVGAGRAWGRHLVEPVPPHSRVDAAEAIRRLEDLMEEVGFDPESVAGPEPEVRLHHCPFLEAAQADPEVVCALHRGLMEGALATLDAPVTVVDLEPFATPRTCRARLRRTDATG